MTITLREPSRTQRIGRNIGFSAAVIALAAAVGLASAFIVTKTSTAMLIILGIALASLFMMIILGRWYLGLFLLFAYIPFEDLFRRVVYFGRQEPHLDPIHLVREFLLASLVAGIMLAAVIRSERLPAIKGRLPRNGVVLLVAIYMGYSVVQIFNPINNSVSIGLQGFVEVGFFILLFFVASYVLRSWQDIHRLVVLSVATGIPVGLYGIYQHVHGLDVYDKFALMRLQLLLGKTGTSNYLYYGTEPRVFSTFGSYEACAAFLCLNLVLAAYLVMRGSPWVRVMALTAVPIMGLCLLYTYSRTNWLGAVGGIALLVVLTRRWQPRQKALSLVFLLLFAVATFGLAGQLGQTSVGTGNPVLQRFTETTTGEGEFSVSQRVKALGFLISYVNQNPLGAGLGANLPSTPGSTGAAKLGNTKQDNYYALLLFELGYPGVLLFLVVAGAMVVTGLRNAARCRDRDVRALGYTLVTGQITLLMISLGEAFLNDGPMPMYFWLFGGVLVLALPRMDLRAQTRRAAEHARPPVHRGPHYIAPVPALAGGRP
ncbi:MAG: O-antigen ligase family protein [Ktedonobacterales bacterium]